LPAKSGRSRVGPICHLDAAGRDGKRRGEEIALKGSDKGVIDLLNEVLAAELTAINQYFVHAEMADNWGYEHRYRKIREEAMGEMKHAEKLIERILFLEGVPNVQRLGKVSIGETVLEQLKSDLALEQEAIARLNPGIEVCRKAGDNGSRMLLEEILESEEEHVNWLEAQLALIDQVGEQNYLSEQIRKEDES
jgi:bacterioferritin